MIFDFIFFGAADAGGFLYAALATGFYSLAVDADFWAVFSFLAYYEPFVDATLFTGVAEAEPRLDFVNADSSLP